MSDISKIKLPSGDIYNIKDTEVRASLDDLVAVHLAGPYNSIDDLPSTGESDKIYLVNSGEDRPSVFDEYIYINLDEPYEKNVNLVSFDRNLLNDFDTSWFAPIRVDNYDWYQAVIEYGTITPPDGINVGDIIKLKITGYNSAQDAEVDTTVNREILWDSTNEYAYIALNDLNIYGPGPDSSLWESGECSPRIIFTSGDDNNTFRVYLAAWASIPSDGDIILISYGNITPSNLTLYYTEEISSLYELVGEKIDKSQFATNDDIDQVNDAIDRAYSRLSNQIGGKAQIAGPYNSVSDLPAIGGTQTLYIVLTSDNKCSAYIWKTGTNYGYKLVSPLETLSFDGPYDSVSLLPATGDSNKIYLVSLSSSETDNSYEEYLYINNSYELIGTTKLDLSNYAQLSDVPTKTSELTNDSDFITSTQLNNKVSKSGDTMTGYLTLSGTPTYTYHAATKGYVDTKVPKEVSEETSAGVIYGTQITSTSSQLILSASKTDNDDVSGTGGASILIHRGSNSLGTSGYVDIRGVKNGNIRTNLKVTYDNVTINNVVDPVNAGDAVNKKYVDDNIVTYSLADATNNGLMSSTQYSRVAQLTDAYINNLIDAKIDAAIAGGY